MSATACRAVAAHEDRRRPALDVCSGLTCNWSHGDRRSVVNYSPTGPSYHGSGIIPGHSGTHMVHVPGDSFLPIQLCEKSVASIVTAGRTSCTRGSTTAGHTGSASRGGRSCLNFSGAERVRRPGAEHLRGDQRCSLDAVSPPPLRANSS